MGVKKVHHPMKTYYDSEILRFGKGTIEESVPGIRVLLPRIQRYPGMHTGTSKAPGYPRVPGYHGYPPA
eukprot:2742126-Rhodomonas_salina.1